MGVPPQASLGSAIPMLRRLPVSGQEPDPPSTAGPCSRYHFCDSPPSSGLSQPLCPSSESSFLPPFPFFLSPHLTDCGSKMAQIYGSTHQK